MAITLLAPRPVTIPATKSIPPIKGTYGPSKDNKNTYGNAIVWDDMGKYPGTDTTGWGIGIDDGVGGGKTVGVGVKVGVDVEVGSEVGVALGKFSVAFDLFCNSTGMIIPTRPIRAAIIIAHPSLIDGGIGGSFIFGKRGLLFRLVTTLSGAVPTQSLA
jgi:hypothetical protein